MGLDGYSVIGGLIVFHSSVGPVMSVSLLYLCCRPAKFAGNTVSPRWKAAGEKLLEDTVAPAGACP